MRLAAIDIGSNAIRLQITNTTSFEGRVNFKKLEYVRFPLRLGHDVFNKKRISQVSKDKFYKLMTTFKLLIELYEAQDYMACATSAMREAENGREIVASVKKNIGLNIQIIDGDAEAELINRTLKTYIDEKTYVHIDVGGGSTEINIYMDGIKMAARSFKLGSVRRLEHHDSPQVWADMETWIKSKMKESTQKAYAIGTGGNINKIFDLGNGALKKSMSINKVEEVINNLKGYTLEERINRLQLNEDRADVIVPASEIYLSAMKWAGADSILVPNVGLKDGMMQMVYERNAV